MASVAQPGRAARLPWAGLDYHWQALIVIVLNIVFGFGLSGALTGGAPVNNWVHGGSLAAGALVGLTLPPTLAVGGRDLSQLEKAIIVAVIAICVVAMAVYLYTVATAPA